MAHEQGQPQAAQTATFVDQHLSIVGREAQPIQSRVEMDHGVERLVEALGRRPPGVELAQVVEHRREAVFDEIALGAGEETIEHVDRMRGQHLAQGDAFVDVGNEEMAATFRRESWPDDGGARAVGVGLEHGGTVDGSAIGPAGIAQAAPVGRDGAEVDGQDRAGPAGRVVGRRRHRWR